jgi:spore coat protein H
MKAMLWFIFVLELVVVRASAAEPSKAGQSSAVSATLESNLPVVFLESKEQIVSERKVPCGVRMVLPKGSEPGNTGTLTGVVRFHGASSQQYPKKSFGITLDAPVRWLGMRESVSWVLNAAFVDRSLMRHKLSYDLFRALSATNAPRFASASRFIEVNLNGKYHGAYLLMERVDRAMFGLRRYDSNALHHACIYKAVDHAANFDRPGHAGYEQREPDPLTGEYWGPLDRFNRFVSSANKVEFFDPNQGIAARLDLDNTIDFHLLVLLTSNMDGFDKNLLLARDAPLTNAPLPRFFFAPWDYDATFGRNWEASRVGTSEWLSNHLFDRLLSDPAYRKKFAARWKQLRAREFSVESIHRMIDENARTLGDAAKRNVLRWRTLEGPYPDRLTFEQDLSQMKDWVSARVKWLDEEIERRTHSGAPRKLN